MPPVGGLPVFGYAAVAALLFGAVLLVPTLTQKGLSLVPTRGASCSTPPWRSCVKTSGSPP